MFVIGCCQFSGNIFLIEFLILIDPNNNLRCPQLFMFSMNFHSWSHSYHRQFICWWCLLMISTFTSLVQTNHLNNCQWIHLWVLRTLKHAIYNLRIIEQQNSKLWKRSVKMSSEICTDQPHNRTTAHPIFCLFVCSSSFSLS